MSGKIINWVSVFLKKSLTKLKTQIIHGSDLEFLSTCDPGRLEAATC